jgi:hypothetical protein
VGEGDLIDQAIEEHMQNHTKHCAQAGFAPSNVPKGERRSKFNEVVKGLQGKGLSIATILGFIGTILNGVAAGNPIASIIAQILSILGNVAPSAPPSA